ncbi:ValS family protein [Neolewinella antarctica]|uniref:DNA repair exonuclease SbcCD ATPase subunit n=1 Tax=Neolewinella antarctica TaxID=442734 RepID=A0ABX0XCN8_9BACT|nr:hypothetical protein [Neolewinella antarctica]NJC26552.1 DNA repair exonuclease SbcCD ATPase subunit [Neolewinella antarctica]
MQTRELFFTTIFLLLALLAGSQVLDAQVSSERLSHSRGNNDAIILELPSADEKMVDKMWSDWLKDTYDVKTRNVKKGKGEMESLNFSMPGVSPGGKVDLYSKINATGKEGSEIIVWIATPDGYVSPELDRGEYYEAEKSLMRFGLAVSRQQMETDVENEEDTLKDLEKELERLGKDKEGYEKDIRNAEKAIEEARAKIDRNLIDQENKTQEIERQIEEVEVAKQKVNEF